MDDSPRSVPPREQRAIPQGLERAVGIILVLAMLGIIAAPMVWLLRHLWSWALG